MASSTDVWEEARRRARNHIRMGLVEGGLKPGKVAKMNIEKQVSELLSEDGCGYIRAAFVTFKVEADDD